MSTITTEWKTPKTVSQDFRYKKVNGGTCYQFYNLDNIKKDDNTYAYQSYYSRGAWRAGTHTKRASPIVYASNYGFNIPQNAKIESIELKQQVRQKSYTYRQDLKTKLVRLKTTSSTTDAGGNTENFAKDTLYPLNKAWTTQTEKITQNNTKIKLTPELINSPNFGQIFQCIGTKGKKFSPRTEWDDCNIARLQIRITYSGVGTAEQDTFKTPKFKITAYIPTTEPQKLSLDYPNRATKIQVKYEHLDRNGTYYGGKTPQLAFSSDYNMYLFSSKKNNRYLAPQLNVKASKEKPKDLYQTVIVYPNTIAGDGSVKINFKQDNINYTLTVKLPVVTWADFEGEFNKNDKNQGCVIQGNTFDHCVSGVGGSYYIASSTDFLRGVKTYKGQEIRLDAEGYSVQELMDETNHTQRKITIPLTEIITKKDNATEEKYIQTGTIQVNTTVPVSLPRKGRDDVIKMYDWNMKPVSLEYFSFKSSYNKRTHMYNIFITYDFKGKREELFKFRTFYMDYNIFTRIKQNVVFVNNNKHTNYLSTKDNKWCKCPRGAVGNYDYIMWSWGEPTCKYN